MKEDRTSKKFIHSYLYTVYGNFFISTIYRASSAMLSPDTWYYETFAWKLDEKDIRTDLIADHSGALSEQGALSQHDEVQRQLTETGIFKEIIK